MRVKFIYNKKRIRKELNFIKSRTEFLKNKGMFYYFPFSADLLNFKKQLEIDEKKFNIEKKTKFLVNNWIKKEKEFFEKLKEHQKKCQKLEIQDFYICYITMYGCYGYYRYPNEIIINIAHQNLEFNLETVIHEIVHLSLYKKEKAEESSEIEKKVDLITKNCLEALKN